MAASGAAMVICWLVLLQVQASSAWGQDRLSQRSFDCERVRETLKNSAEQVECFVSSNLTTVNPQTTPQDDSRLDLPKGAFTPTRDQTSPISLELRSKLPQVPGLQVTGALRDHPQSRWLIRIPAMWNRKLVIAVPDGLGSEYSYDQIWSDFVLQRGYAYAATNKGAYTSYFTDSAHDPHACPLAPAPSSLAGVFVHFYIHDDPPSVPHWLSATLGTVQIAKKALSGVSGVAPQHTYLVGISAGGWVVRLLLEKFPKDFDGGLEWEGANWESDGPNPALDLTFALHSYPSYRESKFSSRSRAYQAMLKHGFPPDVFAKPSPLSEAGSFWETTANDYWERLDCVLIYAIDPEYNGVIADYDYRARTKSEDLQNNVAPLSTETVLQKPLISVHGTMDSVLPIENNGRKFDELQAARGAAKLHRLYEIQNGNHSDKYTEPPFEFTQLEPIRPHAHQAFNLLIAWVEEGKDPPVSQCVPVGGEIKDQPHKIGRPAHCARALEPSKNVGAHAGAGGARK